MRIRLTTNHPVAYNSTDHIEAIHGGAANDNSRNPHFNERLYALFPSGSLSLLDLGCAGGGFVKSLLDDGHFAVGLEGSDYCMLRKKFEWGTIPANLFTCDIIKPFGITLGEDRYDERNEKYLHQEDAIFDVVTCWEVMEHICEVDLPMLASNVRSHLKPEGLWIMSVSEQNDGGRFHKTVKPESWWLSKLLEEGFVNQPALVSHFAPHWVRGPQKTEWAFEAQQSFHLVLSRR